MRACRCRAGDREMQYEALALKVIAIGKSMDRSFVEDVVTIC
jgi:hypothetical protein